MTIDDSLQSHFETRKDVTSFSSGEASQTDLVRARVVSQYKDLYKVSVEGDECFAEVAGRYRHEATAMQDYPAVGDYVLLRNQETDTDRAIIEGIVPRKSVFTRVAAGTTEGVQVIAANVDILFICMALNEDYRINRLERYLSVAWESGAQPVIILTKADLCDDLDEKLLEVEAVAFGIEVITTSFTDITSYDRIRDLLGGGITASFVGSSGIGKSTIVNHLLGKEEMAVGDIRSDGKGRHTTTNRELFEVEGGGAVIDTPGMRELGLASADLSKTFDDIEALASLCRFSDCSHESEPGCAIKQAINEGALDQRRLDSYRKLKKELHYEGMNSKQIEEHKIRTMVGSYDEMKRVRERSRRKGRSS